jgi:hypothetical protein
VTRDRATAASAPSANTLQAMKRETVSRSYKRVKSDTAAEIDMV